MAGFSNRGHQVPCQDCRCSVRDDQRAAAASEAAAAAVRSTDWIAWRLGGGTPLQSAAEAVRLKVGERDARRPTKSRLQAHCSHKLEAVLCLCFLSLPSSAVPNRRRAFAVKAVIVQPLLPPSVTSAASCCDHLRGCHEESLIFPRAT